jgi:hypothetical protein
MIILGIGSIGTIVIGVLFDNLRLRLRLCFGIISTVLVGIILVT